MVLLHPETTLSPGPFLLVPYRKTFQLCHHATIATIVSLKTSSILLLFSGWLGAPQKSKSESKRARTFTGLSSSHRDWMIG
jgi:hypothetical protein